jgi:O-antigen/teichoic acid export membrane protein
MDFVGLLAARGAKLAVGLATMFVYARVFGISDTYDAWVWALGLVNAIGLFVFGPVNETIRASYSAIEHQEGREPAEQYMATIALIMIGASIAIGAAVGAVFSLTGDLFGLMPTHGASSWFVLALVPSIAVSQIVSVLTAQLNCRGVIYRPEAAGIAGGAVGLAFILVFPQLPATWLLVGSYYLGLAAPLLIGASFWPDLARALSRLKIAQFRRHTRDALTFSIPLFLPYGLSQLSGLVERQFALAAGVGALSVLSYAFFARNTVQAVFTAALSAIAVPALARLWDEQARGAFVAALRQWTHQCLMLATIGMIALWGLSDAVPPLLFGARIPETAQLVLGTLLRWYAIAILIVIFYLLGGSALLAARNGRSYAVLGSVVSVGSAVLLFVLFPLIGLTAIPISIAVACLVAAWRMFHAIDPLEALRAVRDVLIRAGVVTVGGSAVRACDAVIAGADISLLPRLAIGLAICVVAGGVWWLIEHRLSALPSQSRNAPG